MWLMTDHECIAFITIVVTVVVMALKAALARSSLPLQSGVECTSVAREGMMKTAFLSTLILVLSTSTTASSNSPPRAETLRRQLRFK